MKSLGGICRIACALFLVITPTTHADASPSHSEHHWGSVTLDNDMFIGNDSGYTNGIYFTYFVGSESDRLKPARLTRGLQWTMPDRDPDFEYNATTLGQVMGTPSDITIESLQPEDIPYSGLIFIQQTNITVFEAYADKASVVLGAIGPTSGAEQSQKVVHKIVGSDEPQGWRYQLENELVFQVSRGRVWRTWHSTSNHSDVLFGSDLKLGTIESSATAGVMFRYGRDIEQTYSTAILTNDRTSNPVNVDGGWYLYAGASAAYIEHLIFLDGNTFRDSPSVDYDPMQVDFHLGFTYAWQDVSMSVAMNNINWFSENDIFKDSKEYGSLTVLWRL